jgi:hypothetical protein
MLTVFAIPKPFVGHTGIIQRNAVRSWCRLHEEVDVILFGNHVSIRREAAELKVRHVGEIETNKYGTPLISHVFDLARQDAGHETRCYVNADVILTGDLVRALRQIPFPEFVMTGRRCNVDVTKPLEFAEPHWQEDLRRLLKESGELALRWALDYFLMRGSRVLENIPPFAVGRPMWDNWFLYHARRKAIPLIDAGVMAMAVHQNHDYHHVPERRGWKWNGPEADANRALTAGLDHVYTLDDATHVLTEWGLFPAEKRRDLRRDRTVNSFKSLPVISQLRSAIHWLRDAGRRVRGGQRTVAGP